MDISILNKSPLVTVLMPVYNAENYLAASIESILSQSYQNFEFILIDDGSTDNSKKIILSYKDSRILCLSNDINLGISSSLNKGIKVSSGNYTIEQVKTKYNVSVEVQKLLNDGK